MIKIAVCVKQVPSSSSEIDYSTGNLIRKKEDAVINPYDRYCIEAALRIGEMTPSHITAFSMGPESAAEALRDAVAMGCDDAVLISDKQFSGADTFATGYTLAKAIKNVSDYDLIVCGRQTTDGDTSQVGPQIAGQMQIPFSQYVNKIISCSQNGITVSHSVTTGSQNVFLPFPCLISVSQETGVPRIPNIRNKMLSKKADIQIINSGIPGFENKNEFGQIGSKTVVCKTYAVEVPRAAEAEEMTPDKAAEIVMQTCEKEGLP